MARRNPNTAREVDPFLESLSWLMDRSIRIGPWSIGLDGILGLIPGVGDATGGLISGFIVLSAMRAGVPKATVLRMIANVAIDSLLGAIPFAGDLFDFVFKANTRNVEILRQSLQGQRQVRRDYLFIAAVLVVLALLIAFPLIAAFYLAGRLLG